LRFQNQEKFANIWLVLTIQIVMPAGCTTLLLSAETKQGKSMQWGEAFKEKCLRKSQRYQSSLKEEKSLCKLNSLTFAAKKPQPLSEIWIEKGNWRKLLYTAFT
jgi:hypothetical protein